MRKKFKVAYGKPSTSKTQMKNLKRKDVYVTYDGITKSPYSKQKLKITDSIIDAFPSIHLKKGSTIFMVTSHGEYHKVKGKSLDNIIVDEGRNPLDIIDDMRFYLKRAKQCIHRGYYDFALINIGEALKVFGVLKINLEIK